MSTPGAAGPASTLAGIAAPTASVPVGPARSTTVTAPGASGKWVVCEGWVMNCGVV